jgi:hypothetical protein
MGPLARRRAQGRKKDRRLIAEGRPLARFALFRTQDRVGIRCFCCCCCKSFGPPTARSTPRCAARQSRRFHPGNAPQNGVAESLKVQRVLTSPHGKWPFALPPSSLGGLIGVPPNLVSLFLPVIESDQYSGNACAAGAFGVFYRRLAVFFENHADIGPITGRPVRI